MAEGIARVTNLPDDGDGDPAPRLAATVAPSDEARFNQLVADHYDRVARVVQRLLGWSADADDVVQDVFVTAWKKLHKFKGDSTLVTWVIRIAVNRCRSHHRRQLVRLRWQTDVTDRGPSRAEPRPEAALMDRETFGRVRRAVASLPGKYREVVALRYLGEMSTAEVAEILSITAATVNVRLHRGRAKLRGMLGHLLEDSIDE